MRYRDLDIPIMDMLFLRLIDWAKEEGYDEFYLGMAPLSRSIESINYKDKTVDLIYNHGNRFYGFKGLRRYKEKYNPM